MSRKKVAQSPRKVESSNRMQASGGNFKAPVEVSMDEEVLQRDREIERKYLDSNGELAENLNLRNPNRSYHKPNIDKPAYS